MPQDNFNNRQIHREVVEKTENDFYPRYLAAKKGIDDRALNHSVWTTLCQALPQTTDHESVNILEIGAGIGTMLERVVERGLLKGPIVYMATDSDPGQLRSARKYLSLWAGKEGHSLSWSGQYRGLLHTASADVKIILAHVRAEELADKSDLPGPFNLITAHAVLDLVDFPSLLPRLLPRLKKNGLAYFTCNFDGETVFLPEHDDEEEVISLYHVSMEARLTGASHTGRRLLSFLQRPGVDLLAVGSSDWIIYPRDGRYSRDEAFFLHAIIATVERELAKKDCPPSGLAVWAETRHRQVDAGELSFLARHLDLLARRHPSLP